MKTELLLSILVSGLAFAGTPELQPTYQSIRAQIFVPKCLQCHAAGAKVDYMPLDDYKNMLAEGTMVIPGDIVKSAIVPAVEDGVMPPKRAALPPVTPEEVQVIKTWITNGAPQ